MRKIGLYIAFALSILMSGDALAISRVSSIDLDKTTVVFINANADGGAGAFDTVISKQIEIENSLSGVTMLEFDASIRNYDPSGNYNQDYALNACFRMMVDGVEVDRQFYIVQVTKWEVAQVAMKSLLELDAGVHLIEVEAGRCWDNVPPFQFIKPGTLKTMSGF